MLPDSPLPASTAPRRERLAFIDAAKGIGISLVVLGHTPGVPGIVAVLIYSFHMPLFFFLAGFVQTATRHPTPYADALQRNARSYLVPYLSFFAISLVYWLATRHLGDRAAKFVGVGVLDAAKGFATGLSADLFVNPALWFLPCLFVCASLYQILRRHAAAATIIAGAAACVALWTLAGGWRTRLPWSLDIAWVALIFYGAGDALRDSRWPVAAWSVRGTLLALPFALVAWAVAAMQSGRVDLAYTQFGTSMLLYAATAFLGIAVVLLTSRLIPANVVLRWLADQSLIIFGLHALLINMARGALKFLHLVSGQQDAASWSLALFAWAMVVSLPASILLRRHFPFLLGRAPKGWR